MYNRDLISNMLDLIIMSKNQRLQANRSDSRDEMNKPLIHRRNGNLDADTDEFCRTNFNTERNCADEHAIIVSM